MDLIRAVLFVGWMLFVLAVFGLIWQAISRGDDRIEGWAQTSLAVVMVVAIAVLLRVGLLVINHTLT